MNLVDLTNLAKSLLDQKQRGALLQTHEATRDRLTPARLKDLPTHSRHIALALGRGKPELVAAIELSDDTLAVVKRELAITHGKNVDVVLNTASSFKLLRDLALEEGVAIALTPTIERQKSNRVYQRAANGKGYVKVARTGYASRNDPYALRFPGWPETLKLDYELEILPFFTDELADKRSSNRAASKKYMAVWLARAERLAGFLVSNQKVPPEDLTFRLMTNYDHLVAYRKFLYRRRGNRDTMTTKSDLEQFRHLAKAFFDDAETANRLSDLIHKQCRFVVVKDKSIKVEAVHADDLWRVLEALVAEAMHYQVNLPRKYGRQNSSATLAHHWMEAAVWAFVLATWLRAGNVAMATSYHIYRKEDGTWHYRFSAPEMKGKRPKADEVLDLWRGDAGQALVKFALDKAIEHRPVLVAHYLAKNPGAAAPENFFLNMEGAPYTEKALQHLFTSASVRYLGAAKRISIHDVRTIVPSWLIVREGDGILLTLQRYLGHAKLATTEEFYLKIQNIFDARLAKLRLEEKARHKKTLEQLAKLPDQVAGAMHQMKSDLQRMIGDLMGAISPDLLKQLMIEALEETRKPQDGQPPAA